MNRSIVFWGVTLVLTFSFAGVVKADASIKKHAEAQIDSTKRVNAESLHLPKVNVEFSNWSNAAQAKANLLPRLISVCEKGFEVVSERYEPKAMGKIELSLTYRCLEK
ncbi:MAG: hypothetical protein ACI4NJ_09030 [Cellvibrio sp.]